MLKYHGTPLHADRKKQGICRCSSNGSTYNVTTLINETGICDPQDRNSTLSTPPLVRPTVAPLYIYAVGSSYEFRIGRDGDRDNDIDAVKHETLFHNADVLAAGEVQISNGVIVDLNDGSASYFARGKLETDPAFAEALLKSISQNSIPVSNLLESRLRSLGSSS